MLIDVLFYSRTKTYIFDAKHLLVKNSTYFLLMNLMLPIDASCTMSTNFVNIGTTCKIEPTLKKTSTNSGKTKSNECEYKVLHLEIPCVMLCTQK